MVSRELEKECIVVFDEAHNIDNVCIEVRKSCHTNLFLHSQAVSVACKELQSTAELNTTCCDKKDQRASGNHYYLYSYV